jgi:hypothetical protein
MDDIGRTQARILAALWALEGAAWLEVQGEIHEAYKEIPFWILLAPDVPPIEAHRHFWRVVEPELILLGVYRMTVSYKATADGYVLWHGFFDQDEMRRALTPEAWWDRPIRQDLQGAGIFRYGRETPRPSATKPKKTNKRRTKPREA